MYVLRLSPKLFIAEAPDFRKNVRKVAVLALLIQAPEEQSLTRQSLGKKAG